MFKELSKKSVAETEKEIARYWEDIDILKRTIENRKDSANFVFFEGPPTANGKPGIHHVIARTLKDSVNKYHTMLGSRVLRKAGWDTHGLPVEIEVEKKLGMNGKQDIEKYGIREFNEQCKDSVFSYEALWREMTRRMAYFIDLDDPYITLDNNYIETEWWILKQFFEKGYMYEGHKILPYCPRCGTGLASHEVAQGYQMIKTDTVYVRFKIKDRDEYFLAWTTTPWTLASNVALAVNRDVTYVKVSSGGYVYILAKELASSVLEGEYEVLEEMKGSDLEYTEYEQLMPFVEPSDGKKAFFVVCADYVSTTDGTGIVHIAPAFGEDDYNVGAAYGLSVMNPVDEQGKYTATPWEGMFVMDADPKIIEYLKETGKLYRKQRMEHNYPHCWRCKTPLLYYAKPSWYISTTKYKDELVAANKTVNWFPDFVGEKRFGNWLENVKDWAISRNRYWGTPLNIWKCECGHVHAVGSRKELAELAIEDIDESIELHRPYVDEVHIRCEKC
ncbi:MAG: class I tRNA ligase family protein, partial [Eubacteriaceae bacterium]|nr:class I tRNA ligase family protein [Eubacteriaceae bacterium]